MAANLAYVEVLTCGADALEPCLLLSVERRASWSTSTTVMRRYLFNVPEEVVRFCGSHQVKLGTLAAAFGCSGRSLAGLPELVLAAAEQGLPRLHLRGPAGVEQFVHAVAETVANPRGVSLLPAEAKAGRNDSLCYEDDYLQVWAVASGQPATDSPPPPKRARRSPEPGVVAYRCQLRPGAGLVEGLPCAGFTVLPGRALAGQAALVGRPAEQAGGGSPGPRDFVFHVGPLACGNGEGEAPSDEPGEREVDVRSDGRRRGLWKPRERLLRWRALCPAVVQALEAEKAEPVAARPVLRAYLCPKPQLESGNDEEQSPAEAALEQSTLAECEEWGLSPAMARAAEQLNQVANSGDVEPELLFLGTGSAKPTSQRGQSAILLRWQGLSALLDCGGGTWAQMVRFLGEEVALETLNRLSLVWISHHHADHCAGLPTLLASRTAPGLRVVASPQVSRFWRSSLPLAGCGRGGALAAPIISDHRGFRLPSDWPVSVTSVPVQHCPQSYALILRTASAQLVYSGDCRPSDELVATALGRGGAGLKTWLVHEATFNPDEQANAKATGHSTTLEALEVSRRLRAQGVLLTHFSQRYAGIELMGAGERGGLAGEQNEPGAGAGQAAAGAAFDGLRLRCGQLGAFGAAREALEEYWSRRREKSEKERRERPPEPRQPLAGAVLPGVLFRGAATVREDAGAAAAAAASFPRTPSAGSKEAPAAVHSGRGSGGDGSDDGPARAKGGATSAVGAGDLESRLSTFYLRLNPEKQGDATKLARLFAGKEAFLNAKLRARYSEDLESQGLSALPREPSSDSGDDDPKGAGHSAPSGAPPPPPGALPRQSQMSCYLACCAPTANGAANPRRTPPPPPPPPPPPLHPPSRRAPLQAAASTAAPATTAVPSPASPAAPAAPAALAVAPAAPAAAPAAAPPATPAAAAAPPPPTPGAHGVARGSAAASAAAPSTARAARARQAGSGGASPAVPGDLGAPAGESDGTSGSATRQLAALKAELAQAADAGDYDRLSALARQMKELEERRKAEEAAAPAARLSALKLRVKQAVDSGQYDQIAELVSQIKQLEQLLEAKPAHRAPNVANSSSSEDSDADEPAAGRRFLTATAAARMAAAAPLEERLQRFYLQLNPEKACDAPKVARLFAGKEDELNEKLRARYNGADLSNMPSALALEGPPPAQQESSDSDES